MVFTWRKSEKTVAEEKGTQDCYSILKVASQAGNGLYHPWCSAKKHQGQLSEEGWHNLYARKDLQITAWFPQELGFNQHFIFIK